MSKRKSQYDISQDDDNDDYCLPQVGKIDTPEEIAQRRIIKISGPKQVNESQARIKTDFPRPVFARTYSIEAKEMIQKKLNESLPEVKKKKSAPSQPCDLQKIKERMENSPPKDTPFSSRSKITDGRRIFASNPENHKAKYEPLLIFKARLPSTTIEDQTNQNANITVYQIGDKQFLTSIQIGEEFKIKDQIILKKESKDDELFKIDLRFKPAKEGEDGSIVAIQFSTLEDFTQFDNLQL